MAQTSFSVITHTFANKQDSSYVSTHTHELSLSEAHNTLSSGLSALGVPLSAVTINKVYLDVRAKRTAGAANGDIEVYLANSSGSNVGQITSKVTEGVYSGSDATNRGGDMIAKGFVPVLTGTNAGKINYNSATKIVIKITATVIKKYLSTAYIEWGGYITTHKVTWKNYDGTVLETDSSVYHGTTPTYNGSTPTRASTAEYTYAFKGWDKTVSAVTADTVYTAQFTATKRTYTVTWKNADGTVLETDTGVAYGTTPTYNGSTPTKASTAQYDYTFSGWSPSVGAITGDTTYTAQFTATVRKYTVRWFNEDGTLLETDTTEYGKMPTYDGATPTKAATAEFTYTFKGWHIEVATVTGAIDYYARYTETTNKYTVLWKNDDGTVLETDTTEYGVVPTYDGATPTKASTAQFTYTFFGWDTTIEEVTRDVVYTAVYTETVNKYTIEASAAEGGTVTGGGTYDYGSSITLTATASPGYKFVQWSDGVATASRTVTVTGNTSYTAVFEKACPIFVNSEQVQAIYVNESTKTITYIIEGKISTANVTTDTVDGWHFEVSNTVPADSHEVTAIYIDETKIM